MEPSEPPVYRLRMGCSNFFGFDPEQSASVDDRLPGNVIQLDSIAQPLGPRFFLDFSRHQNLAVWQDLLRALDPLDKTSHLGPKGGVLLKKLRVHINREHSVGQSAGVGRIA